MCVEIHPAVDKLYGFRRMAPPHNIKQKRIDSQQYMYFMEEDVEYFVRFLTLLQLETTSVDFGNLASHLNISTVMLLSFKFCNLSENF